MIPLPWVQIAGAAAVAVIAFGSGVALQARFDAAKYNGLRADFDQYKFVVTQAALRSTEQAREREERFRQDLEEVQNAHKAKVSSIFTSHRAAIDRVRNDADRSALKPAESAPVTCRTFAASPSQLSREDAELALAWAAEADLIVEERNTCVSAYERLRQRYNEDLTSKELG